MACSSVTRTRGARPSSSASSTRMAPCFRTSPDSSRVTAIVASSMPRRDERSLRFADDVLLVKAHALVALGDGRDIPGHAVAIADACRNARDLVATGLAPPDLPTEALECLVEEGPDVMRLQAAGLGTLHLLPDLQHRARVQTVGGEFALADQRLDLLLVHDAVNSREQPPAVLGVVAVADRLHQQVAKRSALKQLA